MFTVRIRFASDIKYCMKSTTLDRLTIYDFHKIGAAEILNELL